MEDVMKQGAKVYAAAGGAGGEKLAVLQGSDMEAPMIGMRQMIYS